MFMYASRATPTLYLVLLLPAACATNLWHSSPLTSTSLPAGDATPPPSGAAHAASPGGKPRSSQPFNAARSASVSGGEPGGGMGWVVALIRALTSSCTLRPGMVAEAACKSVRLLSA